ncbi:zinc ABC transporter substrate-binding protein [Roseospira visakhapatnamensis]|uniref:High-affinity zinc uptake system protein ZnuA n=1 Tax=Roseospira visakhapatnamensis TaxID=390880 RepID=A0A7W6RBF7_9PROT|nr:zinc ABC transporter substrate-binding protein [Roseospira visakhapatnamensis]MBB4264854.1 zinc transport system substrate-binding protein [Roseospira visakhapatnamensis]
MNTPGSWRRMGARMVLTAGAVCGALAFGAAPSRAADPIGVVASIKPIHALVAAVMGDVGTPHLIVKGGASPHTASLRPSDAAALESADVVVWVGPTLERFLVGPVETLGDTAASLRLETLDGLTRLPMRLGGPFEKHVHGHDHDHDHDHDHAATHDTHDHGHDHAATHDTHDHGHDHAATHDDDHHHDHDHEAAPPADRADPHLWLDPVNARVMVAAIADTLAEADPTHAETYRANAAATIARLDTLVADLSAELAPVADVPFVVFHDAYQYFEHRFGVRAVGSVVVSPETSPGAARLADIRDRLRDQGAVCVFAEPQFEPRLVRVVVEGTEARAGVLDPLGADLPAGPDFYERLIRGLADSLRACLEG